MSIARICLKAAAVIIVTAEMQPSWSNLIYKIPDDSVCVPVFHKAEIAVYRTKEMLEIVQLDVLVPFLYCEFSIMNYPVSDVEPSHPEPGAYELAAFAVMLAIALSRMHRIAKLLLEDLLGLRHMSQAHSLVLDDPDHIIDKAGVVHSANIDLPMVEIVQIVILLHLPVLISQASASVFWTVKYHRLSRVNNWSPALLRASEPGIGLRIAVICPHKDIKQVIPLLAFLEMLFYKLPVSVVRMIQIGRRKV